ncbi:iron complex outermembrane recepter protein [Duganella sp. CF402]|uniref:TonB-dependent receptor n=1 Tax=unclassified Duganella TaxID=2636909 RepID=UPI0008B66741|nr:MULTISPECIES: TonB-dependent receptor [unclassified Duganella]RZT10671.1 iron complex outermembrane receptor protein [Duganella sp. BK701]SEL02848.1 iron complex outermembrane recepter protein [Duganella sp. CF402]
MVLQEKIGVRSVRVALSLLAGSAVFAGHAYADEQIQKVEITGSAIKRINVEGALPVQRLTQEQIAKTGAATVADLIQALPSMQGFTIAAVAAGSNSGGRVSASIHNIGESYTLVLLNGRRIAPQGSGSAINLNAIPMSAVERVEILTDGASALYGSDAIAGVINFILKKNLQGGSIEATLSQPGKSHAGDSSNFSATYGFGDLEENRYNVMLSMRHDEQSQVKATDRSFANTSFRPFSWNGNNYIWDRSSNSSVPGNVTATYKDGKSPTSTSSVAFNPYFNVNGNCGPMQRPQYANNATAQNCGFDSTATIEIVPESRRDSLFGKATWRATDSIDVFAEAAYSRYDLTARIAPNTASISVAKGSNLYNNYVRPYLSDFQDANLTAAVINYRTYDWGTRNSQTITESKNFVVGAEGEIGSWNFGTGLTWSQNSIDERYKGGYIKNADFRSMLANNQFNPFLPAGQQSDATKTLIANSVFNGSIREASTTLKGIDAHASREVFQLPAGAVQVAVGGDYRNYHYKQTPNATSSDIYGFSTSAAYDMERNNYGVFGELNVPVVKSLDVTAAARYDAIEAVKNNLANRDMGQKETANTYKVSARWQPTQSFLLRGSYGTGFKAPSMLDIGQPLVAAGFTSASYPCPVNLAAENQAYCRAGSSQYYVVSGGNENLKPEKSKQYTVGFRFEPSTTWYVQADLWDVKIRDAVSSVSEAQIFNDPVQFRQLFTTFVNPGSGQTEWAKKTLSINIGQTHNQGIDWETGYRHKFGFGTWTNTLNGTYLMKSDYTEPGSADKWTNSMNTFGIDDNVAFRNVVRLSSALETGAFSNSLIVNYRNGYTDAKATAYNLATLKSETLRIHVPSYMTFDWQGKWQVSKVLALRAGVKNLADRNPPLSLRSSSGHQVGYDPRYADPMGRTFYMTGNYSF